MGTGSSHGSLLGLLLREKREQAGRSEMLFPQAALRVPNAAKQTLGLGELCRIYLSIFCHWLRLCITQTSSQSTLCSKVGAVLETKSLHVWLVGVCFVLIKSEL